MYRVDEVSKKMNVSKVTVYNDLKRFKEELEPYITTRNRCKYLSKEGLNILVELKGSKVVNKAELNSSLTDKGETESNQEVQRLKEEVKWLKSQVELGNENLRKQQELQAHTQILLKQSQDQVLLLEVHSSESKKSIWERLFNK